MSCVVLYVSPLNKESPSDRLSDGLSEDVLSSIFNYFTSTLRTLDP